MNRNLWFLLMLMLDTRSYPPRAKALVVRVSPLIFAALTIEDSMSSAGTYVQAQPKTASSIHPAYQAASTNIE